MKLFRTVSLTGRTEQKNFMEKETYTDLSWLSKAFTVFLRCNTVVFSESAGEGARVGIPAGVTHLFVGKALVELGHCILHPLLDNILIGRIPGFTVEQANKIVGMIIEEKAKVLNGQFFGNVSQNIRLNQGEHFRISDKSFTVFQEKREGFGQLFEQFDPFLFNCP